MSLTNICQTYKFRFYRSEHNRFLIKQTDISGIVWNHLLALQRRYYRLSGKHISFSRACRHLTRLKKCPRFSFWKNVGSQALQDILKRQDLAYARFFNWLKDRQGRRVGPPRFKKVKKYSSFTLKQASWELLGGNRLRLRGRNYKFVAHREIEGEIKTVTVKRDLVGNLYVCFSVVREITLNKLRTGKNAGFDFGLKTFLINNEGNTNIMPLYLKAALKQIARLNRQLARKVKGSKNWHKARRRLAKAYAHLANKRRDYHFKLANALLAEFDVLIFETLNIDAMKRLWGRKVSDLGFSQFFAILEHLASQYEHKLLFKIDRWERTTGKCSVCGHEQVMQLHERTFDCEECCFVCDRDHNAARNIFRVGASTLGLGEVRRSLQSAFAVRPQEAQAL